MQQKINITKMLIIIALFFSISLPIFNVLLYGFTWHNDLIYYYDFAHFGYSMHTYTFIPVLYFPFFWFLFKPISYIPIQIVYCILSVIITICTIKIIKIISNLSKISSFERYLLFYLIMIDSAIESTWCNMEIICLFVYMQITIQVMNKNEISNKQIILLALFSFKMVNVLHFIYIILFVKQNKLKSILLYFGLILMWSLPYALIDPNILHFEYLIWIVKNANSTIINEAIIQRNTMMFPMILISAYFIKHIYYKIKYNKSICIIFK